MTYSFTPMVFGGMFPKDIQNYGKAWIADVRRMLMLMLMMMMRMMRIMILMLLTRMIILMMVM